MSPNFDEMEKAVPPDKKGMAANLNLLKERLDELTQGFSQQHGHGYEYQLEKAKILGSVELTQKFLAEHFPNYRDLRHVPKIQETLDEIKQCDDDAKLQQALFRLNEEKHQLIGFLKGMEQVDEEYRLQP